GGALDASQEFAFLPREQFGQGRGIEIVARPEIRLVAATRELVPGTGQLAVVAAEDAVAHERPQVLVDRALVLDGEVADAAARIEHVWPEDRLRRTDVDAARAAAAVRRRRRI